MTSRPSGFTRRNSRSRRLGDSEHDRGERAGVFAAPRQAYLAPGADQARISKSRIRRVSQELLTEAEALLRRSGERMRMSAAHTVVALAAGTGSGKASL